MSPQLVAHGLAVSPLLGWEARIARRAPTQAGQQTFPVMHLASFPLPEQRDDFGGNFTSAMRSSDVLVVLFEYDPAAANKPLFQVQGVPRVEAQMFSPNRLQRRLPGQLGCQLFFRVHNRPFCLYVVAGSRASLPRIVREVNDSLQALEIGSTP